MAHDDIARLTNAVREPIDALTVVVVTSDAQARQIIAQLRPELGERPFAEQTLVGEAGCVAGILDQARKACADWPPGQGVLFLVDETPIEPQAPHDFWRAMNLQRENWQRLGCHVVFFLKPENYDRLLVSADHLAAWIPLKFDVREQGETAGFEARYAVFDSARSGDWESDHSARKALDQLEQSLAQTLSEGHATESTLIRQYYLPMIDAALDIGDPQRASALAAQVDEIKVLPADLSRWWMLSAAIALELSRLDDAEQATRKLLAWAEEHHDTIGQGAASHQLGIIAHKHYRFDEAEQWYMKSLENDPHSGESNAAGNYFQLGRLAQDRHRLEEAEQWYSRALEIFKRLDVPHYVAMTCHQLAQVAQERKRFDDAEQWYKEALATFERLGIERNVAGIYQQLGLLAEDRQRLDEAVRWYTKALEIRERLGIPNETAGVYHQLGVVSQRRKHFDEAEEWYKKALDLLGKHGPGDDTAKTYHQLGMLAQDRGRFNEAEKWYKKSLDIFRRLDYPPLLVPGFAQMGVLRRIQGRLADAVAWYGPALGIAGQYKMPERDRLLRDLATLFEKMGEEAFVAAWHEASEGQDLPPNVLRLLKTASGK